MAREAPIGVRLSPETAEHLRTFAASRGSTVHAEIVRAVDELLMREGGEPEVAALRVATSSLIDRFAWMAGAPDADAEHERLVLLDLVRSGLDALMRKLGAPDEPTAMAIDMGNRAARHVLAEMQRESGTPLAEAAHALGVKGEAKP